MSDPSATSPDLASPDVSAPAPGLVLVERSALQHVATPHIRAAPLKMAQLPALWQQRAQHVLVRTLPQIRYQLTRIGGVGMAGLIALVVATTVAFVNLMPAQHSVFVLRTEIVKLAHVASLPVTLPQGPREFAAALPSRTQIPAVLGVVLVQATAAGIALDQGRYTYSPATSVRLARYTFEFPIKAEYSSVRKFIDRTLEAAPALGLDKLHVERKNVGDTVVSADVGFVVYMKGS